MNPPEAAIERSHFSLSWSGVLSHLIQEHPPLKVMDEALFRSRMVLRFLQENVFDDWNNPACTLSGDAIVGLRTILETTEEMLALASSAAEAIGKVDGKSPPAK